MNKKKNWIYVFLVILISMILILAGSYSKLINIMLTKTKPLLSSEIESKKIEPLALDDFIITVNIKDSSSMANISIGDIFSDSSTKYLGKPDKTIIENIAEGRNYKYYIYPSYTIKSVAIEGERNELIRKIEITKSDIKTKRGITIGDQVNKVIEKYGPSELKNGEFIYDTYLDIGLDTGQPDQFTISFKIDNGVVTGIIITN